jgi:hypothetical protein
MRDRHGVATLKLETETTSLTGRVTAKKGLGGAHRQARQAGDDRADKGTEPQTQSSLGQKIIASNGITSRRASRCRTAIANSSTAACATSF